jgi:hypothetical protein
VGASNQCEIDAQFELPIVKLAEWENPSIVRPLQQSLEIRMIGWGGDRRSVVQDAAQVDCQS